MWPGAPRAVSAAVAALCAAGALATVFDGSGGAATTRASPELFYEAQTGPSSFAIDALRLSTPRTSTEIVALRNANVDGIAVGGRWVYWSTQNGPRGRGAIMRAPLAGGRAHRLVGGLTDAGSIVVVGRYVYWNDQHAIGRVAVDGSHLRRRLIRLAAEAGGGVADGLASDGRHLYFSRCSENTIGRADLNGRQIHERFISLAEHSCPQGLAVAAGHLFWTELGQGLIGRVRLDGHTADARWLNVHTRQGPFQVAAGGGRVYWTWGGENGTPSYTGRADANRSHLERRFLPDSMYPMAFSR